jgi:hypothetical protein
MDDKSAERTNDAKPEDGQHGDRPADREKYLDQQFATVMSNECRPA